MNDIRKENKMPVFLVNGFLEAGKTQFLEFTMCQEYFQIDGKTLLIVCEEGDTEYDEETLEETQTLVIQVEDQAQLTPRYLKELEEFHQPDRILMEWNGMWNQADLRLPEDWAVFQQITIVDASTFDLYLKNMKPLLAAMVRNSEMIILNRCDELEDLSLYQRTLKALNSRAELIFEDSDGEIEEIAEGDLPYDMTADIIEISPDAYGIWYIDCMDKEERYQGKTVEFTAMALKPQNLPKNFFVPGRMAMTCCEDDMTFLGYICKFRNARNLDAKAWVKIRAVIRYEEQPEYGGKGPVLYAEQVEPASPIGDVVQF